MSKIQAGGWSKEEFLGNDKYSSNMYSNNQGDLSGNSSDKDVHHKRIRMMRTQKYIRENYYHHIECTAATFQATFMLKKPLNNAVLATTTHKKLERVSDRTNTQVRLQMINKCRIKMGQREIYNVRDPP